MKQTVLDVLVYLFEHCMESSEPAPDRRVLHSELKQAGFADTQIAKAFDWVDALAKQRDCAAIGPVAHGSSLRVSTADECEKITREARGLILYLERLGVLTASDRELVIERAMALEADEIDADELKWIVLMVLFNQPGREESFVWVEDLVMDELRGRLH